MTVRTRTGRVARYAAGLVAATLVLTACSDEVAFEPVGGVDAALTTTSDDVRVGVIVSTQGPGVAALGPAHGAVVAAARFNGMGGDGPVELVVADDLGSSAGAEAAVDELVEAGVDGIVHASIGTQVGAAAARADAAGVPLLAPLATDAAAVADTSTSWLTGPTRDQLAAAVTSFDAGGPVLHLAADAGLVPAQADAPVEVAVTGGLLDDQVSAEAARVDPAAVAWWGDPLDALGVVSALQRSDRPVPVLLDTTALLPGFARALAAAAEDAGLIASATLYAPGPVPPEDGAVETRAFRVARDLVAARGLPGLAGAATDEPSTDLVTADPRVHDAVLDLVAAVDAAAGRTPDAVVDALRSGGPVPGRVLPRPDYGAGQAPFPAEAVVILQAAGLQAPSALPAPAAGPVLRWAPISGGVTSPTDDA